MQNYNYNQQLIKMREDKSLPPKEAAKEIGISSFSLFLYETGYFRPKGKHLEKIESFYGAKIDFTGDRDYPGEIHLPTKKIKTSRKKKIIIASIVAAISVGFLLSGSVLLTNSTKNVSESYGAAYQEVRQAAIESGGIGSDMVTGLEYHYLNYEKEAENASIIFYDTNNILFFNESVYSLTLAIMDIPEAGSLRIHYRFGDALNKNSFICYFTAGSISKGTFVTAEVNYHGGTIDHFDSYVTKIKGTLDLTEEIAVKFFNARILEAKAAFDKIIGDSLNRQVDFLDDFLAAREVGRKVNLNKQMLGFSFILPAIVVFFASISFLLIILVKFRKDLLIPIEEEARNESDPLPKDIHLLFGIPDYLILRLSSFVMGFSLVMMLFGIIGKSGLPFFSWFANDTFIQVMTILFMSVPFLKQFILINSMRSEKQLFSEIIKYLLFYIILASLETLIIGLADLWGYDFKNLIYNYIPGNIFQIVIIQYLIYMFLFFEPKFIKEKNKKTYLLIWRLLSILPVGLLVATTIIGNSYELFYGVKKNVYLLFWFPDTNVTVSIIFVLFIYATFFIRLYFNKKYGKKAPLFFHSDRYMLILNLVYISLMVFIIVLTLILARNEVAYYLGFTTNYWLLLYIPIVLLAKSAPSTVELYQNDELIEHLT